MAQKKLVFHSASGGTAYAGFGRMIIASLVVHALVVVLFSGIFVPLTKKKDRPVYYVDLVNLPVERPQAGRPDGSKSEPAKAKKAAPKAVEPPKPPPAKAAEKVKLAPEKTPAVKEKPPAVKTPVKKEAVKKEAVKKDEVKKKDTPKVKPRSVEKDYQQSVLGAVEALRAKKKAEQAEIARKAKIEALKNKLAAMTTQDSRSAGGASDAPLGVPDGRGDQAGVSHGLWLQTYLTSNWSLSKYQLSRQDLEAEIHVEYDREGNLIRKRLVRSSGDKVFDRSVENAVLKSSKLPITFPQRVEFDIIFNLKDLPEKN
ncbi:MAG: TonB C-terminal domain-containing protein [Deltaproteobacteria bacterium]|nr:TonB C-terminal domain-containing protein [Deltaproteobacteria bacterium]